MKPRAHFLRRWMILALVAAATLAAVQPGLSRAHAATALEGNIVADLGFRPDTNGFSFENYGGENGVQNLTPDEVKRLFGDQVCASVQDGKCILTPPAQQWMDQNNESMNGGHCEGMAALSLLMYMGKEKPTDFGNPTTPALTLPDNSKLQHEIAYWFSTQSVEPTSTSEMRDKTPSEILDILINAMKDGANAAESYTMGIYQRSGEGGHAITPYAVADQGNNVYWVMVYDNNWPGIERHVEINRDTNTWTYNASTNPDEPESVYEGDAETKSLTLTPSSVRLDKQVCPFCEESTTGYGNGLALAKYAAPVQYYNEIWLDGKADLLITDAQNHRLGVVNGKLVNEIPGATFTSIKSGDLWKDEEQPVYDIPLGIQFTITLDGSKLKAEDLSEILMIGPGHDLAVENIKLQPGQQDSVTFSPDGTKLSYKTSNTEAPDLILGIEHAGADYSFLVKGVDVAGGGVINVSLDYDKGTLSMNATGSKQSATFGVVVDRIDDQGEQTFSHDEGITLDPGDTATLEFGKWSGQSGSMTVNIDRGSDGTVDETVTLTDEK